MYLRRVARTRHLAPHSFSSSILDPLPTSTLRHVTFREARLETLFNEQRFEVNYSAITSRDQFDLYIGRKGSLRSFEMLPGGRWIYGEVLWGDRRKGAVLWDLARLTEPGSTSRVLSPVAEISTSFISTESPKDPAALLRIQYDPEEAAVNHLFMGVALRRENLEQGPNAHDTACVCTPLSE